MPAVKKAIDLYSARPKLHNCAQAVACGHDREDLYETLRSFGGGRAPDGLCGALYAAIQLCPEQRDAICREFAETLSSEKCADLKNAHGAPCQQCVIRGAELVEKYRR